MPSRRGHPLTNRAFPEASLEVFDVSREFPGVTVVKFTMSDRLDDTLCYKIGCRLLRRLDTVAYGEFGPYSRRRR
jgi:hypothetical protein